MKEVNPHWRHTYKFRPILTKRVLRWNALRRYANGRWVEDDGRPDYAFVYGNSCIGVELPERANLLWSWMETKRPVYVNHPDNNPWHYHTTDGKPYTDIVTDLPNHINTIAIESGMRYILDNINSCANGRSVDFNPLDKHIRAGTVIAETGEVVRPPDILHCFRCNMDFRLKDIWGDAE